MHDMGRPSTDIWRGWSAGAEVLVVWSFSVRILPFLSASAVGGLGYELFLFVVGRSLEAFQSEMWQTPFVVNLVLLPLRSLH